MKTQQRIEFANTLRGLAALAVLVSHYFDFFWNHRDLSALLTNTAYLPDHYATPLYVEWASPGLALDWGAYGVGLFFVISGFVIPFSLKKETWKSFAIRRLLRTVPTYAVGFTLSLLMIWVGSYYFHRNWPYAFSDVAIHYFLSLRDVLMSRNIDGVIWTLELEMKFYFVCVLLMVWLRKHSLKVFVLPMALFAAAILSSAALASLQSRSEALWLQAVNFIFVARYLIFLFTGVVFHYAYQGRLSAIQATGWGVGLFLMFCTLWWCSVYRAEFESAINYLLALLTFTVAYGLRGRFRRHRVTDFLANISYPLYVIHCVAGMAALRILIDQNMPAWLALVIVTASALISAWLLHRTVEVPARSLSKKWVAAARRAVRSDA
jgi:peptidoglycan/LPS O-acetylase OafA/YrhL